LFDAHGCSLALSIPPAIIRISVSFRCRLFIRPPPAILLKDGADLFPHGLAKALDLAVLQPVDSLIDSVSDDFGIVGDGQGCVEIEIVAVSVGYRSRIFP